MNQTRQRGSMRTFVIVAVVLVLSVVGVSYFVKQRGEAARRDQAIAQADQPTAADTPSVSSSADSTVAVNQPAAAATSNTPSTGVSSSSQLPATGPESGVLNMSAIGILTAAGVNYMASRRASIRPL